MTYNDNPILLLYFLINCISARSATLILSLNDGYTFLPLTFLIISLWISSESYWFTIDLIPLPEKSLTKNL